MSEELKIIVRELLIESSYEIGMILDAADYSPSAREFIESRRQKYEQLKEKLWSAAKEL